VSTERANRVFDRVPRTRLRLARWSLVPFTVCVYAGLAGGTALALALTRVNGASIAVTAGAAAASVGSFFALAFAKKRIEGAESLVFYHHAAAACAAATLVVVGAGEPLLPYLDLAALGIGLVLATVRIGCLCVGCCHGRPAGWGVRYGHEHAAIGFPSCYVGVRLLPVQALEAAWTFAVVAAGAVLVLPSQSPGAAFAWFTTAYAAGRFLLEFLRGDADRTYLWRFSEPQWTSAVLVALVWVADRAGVLPTGRAADAAVVVVGAGVCVALAREWRGRFSRRVATARHTRELAEILERLDPQQPPVPGRERRRLDLYRTTLGVLISASALPDGSVPATHYAISREDERLSEAAAAAVGTLILRVGHGAGRSAGTLVPGGGGCFHLLVHEPRTAYAGPAARHVSGVAAEEEHWHSISTARRRPHVRGRGV